jgi:uncharacterized phage protein gp47/JayE
MAQSAADISSQMRAQLKVLDPAISADPVTPERKIIDTVAEVLADNQIDYYVLNYQYDIDTKVGIDLDRFVALFGFARQTGRRATGSVTFERATISDHDILIEAGTQVVKPATNVSIASIFFTTASVVLPQGALTVEAPIEASNIGALGNVPAGTITTLGGGSTTDISSVRNENGTTGGTGDETDAELRLRFKNTVFRNISGTKDQYLALAIASRFANKATIIGPQNRYQEWTQVPSTRVITSQIPYSKYTYAFDYYLTDGDPTSETFYTPRGVDYTLAATVPPTVTVNSSATTLAGSQTLPVGAITVASTSGFPTSGKINIGGQLVTYTGKTSTVFTGTTGGTGTFPNGTAVSFGTLQPGAVTLLEHTYCSTNSRNDPTNNVLNYVDVYVSGQDVTNATEVIRFPTNSQNFTATTSSPYYTGNYRRTATGVAPAVGNRFVELLWQPVSSLPSIIIIEGRAYYLGSDYFLVSDTTNFRQSRRGRDGIEWAAPAAASIATGTMFSFTYAFDRLPLTLNELMDRHKQVTTDVLVHSAQERYLNISLIVMYTGGFAKSTVDEAISAALEAFLERQLFGTVIQISDIIEVVHAVPGVDNVRLATPSDGVSYGIQEMAPDGVTPVGYPRVTDFLLQDIDLPILNAAKIYQRSQNTW